MRESILHSVSMQEMQTMRDSGMTNAQIAAALDCSQATVYRVIGKMPHDLRSKAHVQAAPAKPAETPHTLRSALMITARVHELRGEMLALDVRTGSDGVNITFNSDLMGRNMSVEQLETLSNELSDALDAIRRVLK